MKPLLLLLALLPCLALAEGYGGADGTNQLGERVHLGDDAGDGVDTIYVYARPKDDQWKERYPLFDECPSFLSGKQFSCRKNGKSPLAGATYRVGISKKYKPCNFPPGSDTSPGEVYSCVAGCDNPRVPKIIYVSPWECVP